MSLETSRESANLEENFLAGAPASRGLQILSGEGAWLRDSAGRRYLDCMSMIGVASTGHAHPAVASAIAAQAQSLITCGMSFANDRRAELISKLRQWIPSAERFFFCNSGTEAMEAAVKTASHLTSRHGFVHLEGSFHGRTLGSLALTSRRDFKKGLEPLLFSSVAVPREDPAALEAALDENVAALILEPIQGEGGVRPLSEEYLQTARRLTSERGVLLIADEVQCGVGRSGRFLASEYSGIEADLVCLAKGLASGVPIGVLALHKNLAAPRRGLLGSTFGGNPLAAAAACATLDIIRNEKLCARAEELGRIALEKLMPLTEREVREVRGRGLMIGIELRTRVGPLLKRLQEAGILAVAAGPNVLRLLPPLVIRQADWTDALDRICQEIQA